MSRHLGALEDDEWEEFCNAFATCLDRLNVSGSLAGQYNLYEVLDEERDRARDQYLYESDDDVSDVTFK